MLFQYGLLFFLFTTFAAAAPAGVPPAAAAPPTAEVPPTIQRRTLEDFAEYHGDFLMANHGVWTWDKTVSRLYIHICIYLTLRSKMGQERRTLNGSSNVNTTVIITNPSHML